MKSVKFRCTKEEDQAFVTLMKIAQVYPKVEGMYKGEEVRIEITDMDEDEWDYIEGQLIMLQIKFEVFG